MNEPRTVVLLAGGRSVRMGRDKAFVGHEGKPLWQHQAELIQATGAGRWLLSCRREQGLADLISDWAREKGMEVEVVLDPVEEEEGAGGMIAALVRCLKRVERAALVLTVDMPLVSEALVEELWRASEGWEGGVFFEGERGVEPFPGLYHRTMLPVVEAVAAGERSPSLKVLLGEGVALGLARVMGVGAGERFRLGNWNRPEDVGGGGVTI
jgi:molybdopterin-guanine dinucleotide biosynthesis protein A